MVMADDTPWQKSNHGVDAHILQLITIYNAMFGQAKEESYSISWCCTVTKLQRADEF
jgi:hypothetical protein